MVKPDLSAALADPEMATKGPTCAVAIVLEEMPDADRTALLEAIGNPRASGTWISKVLAEHGYTLAGFTINRHRRGECRCH